MKILLLNDRIPPEGRGGAESVVWRLARGLADAGHEIHVAAATAGDSFEEIRDGIPTYHLHANYPERFRAWLSLWNPQTAGAFRDLLQRIQPDVVNAHNIHSWLTYHSLKLAREAGCGVVFSAHDAMTFAYGKLHHFVQQDTRKIRLPEDYRLPAGYNLRENRFRYNPFRNLLIRRYLSQRAHIRTVPSRALADAWSANDMPPAEVVHNGIDPAEWALVSDDAVEGLRRRLDLVDKQVILIAGRMTSAKGTVQILQAMDRLREALPQMRLLVLTSRDLESQIPPEYAHLRTLIVLGGWLSGEELCAAFHLADVVAVPSIVFDTFPTVALEAMAAGTPVIATGFGGAAESVVDGESGYIVNPFDSAGFADRLARTLKDSDLRREMGRLGRERVATAFSLEGQVAQMLELYERAIAN